MGNIVHEYADNRLQELTSKSIVFLMDYSGLKVLPHQVWKVGKKLEVISVSYNHLTALPTQLSQLKDLVRLSANSNQIRAFPSELCCLQNLMYLSLSSNKLAELPPEINQLVALKTLDVSHNELKHLPSLAGLNNLAELFVSKNSFAVVPSDLPASLRELNFAGNILQSMQENTISHLTLLESLDLSEKSIHRDPLGRVPTLFSHSIVALVQSAHPNPH